MKIFVKYVEGLELPKKAHDGDMGYDVISMSDPKIKGTILLTEQHKGIITAWYSNIDYIEYDTGLQIAPEKGGDSYSKFLDTHVLAFPRSSVTKYNLILKNCIPVIDSIYRGNVILRFAYQWQPQDLAIKEAYGMTAIVGKPNLEKIYKKGDKIAQFCAFNPLDSDYEFVQELPQTERGEGKFGSTGN